jgi:hypothetical protein
VCDSGGTVIGASDERIEPETPAEHASVLLGWAREQDGLQGRWVLQSYLALLYRGMIIREYGLRRMPWVAVAKELRKLTGGRKDYRWVRINGRRVKRRAYFIPADPS